MTEHATIDQPTATDVVDVLVVGAGFAGLYQLARLRERGFAVKVWEEGAGLGGVWWWNCYPGARVDSPGRLYQYSDRDLWQGWDWSEAYPGWEELREYFAYVDGKLDLTRDIRFGHRVTEAQFDEATRRWTVTAADGDVASASYLVMCTGFAAKPYVPEIAGLQDFAGDWHHTARWPQDGIDFSGRRVAVVGTGASGVQVIQEAARTAEHLTVFQRTPNIAIPMRQKQLSEEDQRALKAELAERLARRPSTFAGADFDYLPKPAAEMTPAEREAQLEELWAEGGFRFWLGTFPDVPMDMDVNRQVYEFWRDRTRERIDDPAIAEKLAPTVQPHPFGVVRPSLEQWYFEVFNQDNVRLVDVRETPIERVTATGAVTAGGEHEFDLLVFATGFDAVTGGLTGIDVRGTSGETLRDKWADGVRAHLGVATSGFPNLLFLYGPQSPGAFCNGPTCAELQGDLIVDLLTHLQERGLSRVEATDDADEAWRQLVLGIADQTLFRLATSGWYVGANVPGKKRELLQFAGGLPMYLEQWRAAAASGYAGFELS